MTKLTMMVVWVGCFLELYQAVWGLDIKLRSVQFLALCSKINKLSGAQVNFLEPRGQALLNALGWTDLRLYLIHVSVMSLIAAVGLLISSCYWLLQGQLKVATLLLIPLMVSKITAQLKVYTQPRANFTKVSWVMDFCVCVGAYFLLLVTIS